MNYKITEVLLNQADKYIVRVVVDENNSTFLKFDHYPTQEEVDREVQNFINQLSTADQTI